MIANSSTLEPVAHAHSGRGGKYLTFALGREEYGLEILKVREIIGYMDITSVPRMPAHVKGVINLRGQVISVIDLRAKFGMEAAERTEHTCIIVVEIHESGRRFHCGVVVDHVLEVLNIGSECIEDPPSLGAAVRTDFIVGLGKVNDSVKILLNVDKVLDMSEVIDPPAQAGAVADRPAKR